MRDDHQMRSACKGRGRRLILCIVRVTGGRRSLCKFFQEKPGWTAAKNDDELKDDFNEIFREGADDSSRDGWMKPTIHKEEEPSGPEGGERGGEKLMQSCGLICQCA